MQPRISVVIPVYQAENYIRRCLDSLQNQSLDDFEVILVDDGSTDMSGIICDEYARIDSRFSVIHQKNGGVSQARQTGLDYSTGKYVIHADPDDWMETDWLECLLVKAESENLDIVLCDFYVERQDRLDYYKQRPTSLCPTALVADIIENRIWGVLWNKLLKRETILKKNVSFCTEMSLWEDLYFITDFLIGTNVKIGYVNKALYHYDVYTNPTSIVRTTSVKRVESTARFINDFARKYDGTDFQNDMIKRKIEWKMYCYSLGSPYFDVFRNTYPEVNTILLSYKRKNLLNLCMAECIKGNCMLSSILFRLYKLKLLLKK